MMEDQSLKEVQLAMYHNYPVRYLTLAIFALTASKAIPSVEARAAPLRAHAQEVFDHILDLTNFITPMAVTTNRWTTSGSPYAPLRCWPNYAAPVGNNDPARRYTLFHHYTDTYLYKVLPDGTTARDDDNEFPYLSGKTTSASPMRLIVSKIHLPPGSCATAAGPRAKITAFRLLSFCGMTGRRAAQSGGHKRRRDFPQLLSFGELDT
jgi:hypothetical protein